VNDRDAGVFAGVLLGFVLGFVLGLMVAMWVIVEQTPTDAPPVVRMQWVEG